MLSLQKDISSLAVQVGPFHQVVKLTKGQKGLLKLMRDSVENKTPVSWDSLVHCYYHNVNAFQAYVCWHGEGENRKYGWVDLDILKIYKEQGYVWQYKTRSRIRQWFITTLGTLVLKNQLIVIPTIEIGEE